MEQCILYMCLVVFISPFVVLCCVDMPKEYVVFVYLYNNRHTFCTSHVCMLSVDSRMILLPGYRNLVQT